MTDAATPNEFAILLKMSMDRRGESQERAAVTMNRMMAEELGHEPNHIHVSTSQATISKWLEGRNGPNRKKWNMIARYCDVPRGTIERLCGDPSESSDVGVLREELVNALAECRRLEHKNAELQRLVTNGDRRHQRDRTQLRKLEATLYELRQELAMARASTPTQPTRRRTAVAG